MGIFGKNGLIRQQEVNFAFKLLTWKYEKSGHPAPGKGELKRQAEQVVDEAHRIAKERGTNVMAILKETIEGIKNKR